MTGIELGAIISAIVTIVGGWLGYRQHKLTQDVEKGKEKNTQEREFIADAMARVDKLEVRVDSLTDRILETARTAEEERRKIVENSELRMENVRKEMRRLIDDANLELATWRDKYFTLTDSYHRLKLEYASLEIKFDRLDKEYGELRGLYRRRTGEQDHDPDTARATRDIQDTP